MIDAQARVALGQAAARKGKDTELKVARYLRAHGWPDAERAGRTGWRPRGGDRVSADPGDIRGTEGLVWQIKAMATMSDLEIRRALSDTATQALSADYGILVQRRTGKSDVGRWWAWLPVRDLCALTAGAETFHTPDGTLDAPARMELGALVPLLHRAGYGDAP